MKQGSKITIQGSLRQKQYIFYADIVYGCTHGNKSAALDLMVRFAESKEKEFREFVRNINVEYHHGYKRNE